MRSKIKAFFGLWDIYELQTGGWCGLCGKVLPHMIVPIIWPYSMCDKCSRGAEEGEG